MGDYGQQSSDLRFEPFVVPESREDDHHCGAEQVIVEVALQEARAAQKLSDGVHLISPQRAGPVDPRGGSPDPRSRLA